MPAVAKIPESKIEAKLVRWCREEGIYTRKFSSPAHRGVPDRIFCRSGKVVFLELKRLGNIPTALQEHELLELRRQGMIAEWVDSFEQGRDLLSVYLARPRSLI